ncbi:MAG: bifunctional diguanylate cyclase/phosphodiesterase, partial [Amaricoccus sp.]
GRRGWHSPRAAPAPTDGAAVRGAILPRIAAQRIVEAALRAQSENGDMAVFMIDLDRFRSVNEALGMAAGDALLAVTGARLERALDRGDRLVRLEGDRFVVLASHPPDDPEAFARRLLEVVAQPLVLAGHTVAMQASIGVVATTAGERNAAALLLRADSAMRRAKAEGRNRSALHEPRLDAANLEKSQLELDLSNAPHNGQMHLTYQPFVDLDLMRVTGVEALLRWRHPTRGEVQPKTFIPLAESTGLILPIGTWALRTACAEAARWPVRPLLAVNISALQFHQPGFTAQIDAVLAETGFPADCLELEITETVLMRDNPETIGQLEALIARGIRIALDDFGTGYSALAYLARLPHHRIKLDKSFVQDLTNPATAELIRAIIAQARANGVCVTAEGVEVPDQLAQVRAMGFTHAQGYATGAPTADPVALFSERLAAS